MNPKDPRVWLPIAVLAGAGLLSLLAIVTASGVETAAPPTPMLAVRVVAADPRPVRLVVRSQGTVAPRTESALIPEVSGPVVWTSPDLVVGGFFRAGDPLLRIDRRDYETARVRARAALARAEGEHEYARATLARLEGLAARDIASPAQLDEARRAARVSAASVDEARAQLAQATRDLDRTELRAPYDGRVRTESVDVGQFLSRGQPVADIYATDYVEVRLPVPDTELAYLDLGLFADEAVRDPGTEVALHARFAGAEHTWKGSVVRTEGEIDAKSRMVHVVARVEKPYEPGPAGRPPLAVGLFVTAEIAGPEISDVISIPRGALRTDPADDRTSVLIVDAEDRLRQRPVEVVRVDREDVLVRGAIGSGDRICVSPVRTFLPGLLVSVESEAPALPQVAPAQVAPTGEEPS